MTLQDTLDRAKTPKQLWFSEVRKGFAPEDQFSIDWDNAEYLFLNGYTAAAAVETLKSLED